MRSCGYTPTPALSHAILTYNRGRTTALADGIVITPSHNPPDDGGFKYNPPNGGRPIRRHQVDREPRQRTAGGGAAAACGARPYARALAAPPRTATITSRLCRRSRRGGRPGRGARRRRFRSAPIRWAAPASPTGAASRSATACNLTVVTHDVDPTFRFMSRRLGRQDPHGLLVAVRHGRADRAEGPLRHRLRLRHRPRPPRHRDAQRRAAESESLPGGRDLVPVPNRPDWRGGCRGRQDAGLEQHDRPGGRQPGRGTWWKCRWDSSGSWTGCSTARWVSAARRAPARRSCAGTGRCGRPTRTASSMACWPPR